LTGASKAALASSKEGVATLASGSTAAGTGTGLGLAKGAGLGAGICKEAATLSGSSTAIGTGISTGVSKIATLGGLVSTGTIAGMLVAGGIGLLVGYLTYRGVKAFVG
jgi:hypothetical protein